MNYYKFIRNEKVGFLLVNGTRYKKKVDKKSCQALRLYRNRHQPNRNYFLRLNMHFLQESNNDNNHFIIKEVSEIKEILAIKADASTCLTQTVNYTGLNCEFLFQIPKPSRYWLPKWKVIRFSRIFYLECSIIISELFIRSKCFFFVR